MKKKKTSVVKIAGSEIDYCRERDRQLAAMNSYFEQSGFYGQGGGAAAAPDYRFSIGLGGLGAAAAYGQHQPPRVDPAVSAIGGGGFEAPGSPSKSSLYSSLSDPSPYRHAQMKVVVCHGNMDPGVRNGC